MTHASYVPSYVPSYCENMRLTPPAYFHDLDEKWDRDDAKVIGLIRTSNPGFGEIEGTRHDFRKQLVWVCHDCYGTSKMGTLMQLFDPTWEPDWKDLDETSIGDIVE